MHIHVLGLGAVGTLVSHYLRAALDPKHVISIIHRAPDLAATATAAGSLLNCERDGVVITSRGFQHESVDPYDDLVYRQQAERARQSPNDPEAKERAHLPERSGPSSIESLIVATKAPVAVNSIMTLLPRLSANSTIVLLHNGMGVYEDLLTKVFRNREQRPHIVFSTNNHGAFLKERNHVVHTGVGNIQLAITPDAKGRDFEATLDTSLPLDEQKLDFNDITPITDDPMASRYISLRNTISALMSATPLNVSWQPLRTVEIGMRRKLVVNSFINPLTALLNCRNDDILKVPGGRRICERLCVEASSVFHAQWVEELRTMRKHTESPSGNESAAADHLADQHFPYELRPPALVEECERVVNSTRANVSSMLIDVRRGKKTEVMYINGYLLSLAKRYKVPVPLTASLLDLVLLRTAIPLDISVPTNSIL